MVPVFAAIFSFNTLCLFCNACNCYRTVNSKRATGRNTSLLTYSNHACSRGGPSLCLCGAPLDHKSLSEEEEEVTLGKTARNAKAVCCLPDVHFLGLVWRSERPQAEIRSPREARLAPPAWCCKGAECQLQCGFMNDRAGGTTLCTSDSENT